MKNNQSEHKKDARLVTRATPDAQDLIKTAAEMTGATVSQFLLEAAVQKAQKTIETMNLFRLKKESADLMYEHLNNPEPSPSALNNMTERYKERINHNDDTFTFNFTEQESRP